MFHTTAFDRPTKLLEAEALLQGLFSSAMLSVHGEDGHASVAVDELAFRVLATFRAHPHINNVLTHISGGNWSRIERALRVLLDVSAPGFARLPLETNLLDLMCAERGVTGRIMTPYVDDVLRRIVGPHQARRLIRHLTTLFISQKEQSRR